MGMTALHFAARAGNVPCMKFLIEQKANVMSKTARKETLLHLTARCGHIDAIMFLLDLNLLNLDDSDYGNQTAWQRAPRPRALGCFLRHSVILVLDNYLIVDLQKLILQYCDLEDVI